MRFDFECWVVVPRLLAVGLIAAAMSCYGTVSFIPRERVVAESPLGVPAAQYELGSPEHRMGEVRIWSDGGSYKELAGHGEAVVVAVGMEIENGTDRELRVDAVELEQVDFGGGDTIARIQPVEPVGAQVISAKAMGELRVQFALPEDAEPADVLGFAVRWRLAQDDLQFEELTPFRRMRQQTQGAFYGASFYGAPLFGSAFAFGWPFWGSRYCW